MTAVSKGGTPGVGVRQMEGGSASGGPQKPFICGYVGCKKSYQAKQHLVRHVKVFHYNIVQKESVTCNECHELFTCKQNLKKHIARKHNKDFPFKCHFCPHGFKRKTLLAYHLYQHTGTKLLSCDICGKTFANQTERGRHRSKHKIFKCECDLVFTNWGEILEHKKKQHVSPEYQCDLCQRVFKSRAYIVRHMKIHTLSDERMIFVCPKCPKFYTFKSNLVHHINSAHENKTYNCTFPECGAKLSTQSKLNFHYARHINPPVKKEKSFKPRKKRRDAGIKRKLLAEKIGGTLLQPIQIRGELTNIKEAEEMNPPSLTNTGNVMHIKKEIIDPTDEGSYIPNETSYTPHSNIMQTTLVKIERCSDDEEFQHPIAHIKTEELSISDQELNDNFDSC